MAEDAQVRPFVDLLNEALRAVRPSTPPDTIELAATHLATLAIETVGTKVVTEKAIDEIVRRIESDLGRGRGGTEIGRGPGPKSPQPGTAQSRRRSRTATRSLS